MSRNDIKTQRYMLLEQHRNENPSSTPRVLVLVGIPGSGKTTFAKQLVEVGWKRINQDELGSRQTCENKMVEYLLENQNVIIDRCNFDKQQRKHWIEYAQHRGCTTGVIVFAIPINTCIDRVSERKNHPTLTHGEEENKNVILHMAESLRFPDRSEGFVFCRVIKNEIDNDRVLMEILDNP